MTSASSQEQDRSHIRTLTLGGLTVSLLPKSPYCANYTPVQPLIGFALESQAGWHAFASDRIRPFYAGANGLAFTPAGCSIYSEAPAGGEYLTVSGETRQLASLLGREDVKLPSRRFSSRVHAEAVRAAFALRRSVLTQDQEPTAIETAVADLLNTIGECSDERWRTEQAARSMTVSRRRNLEALVEARLSDPLTIAEMASACGLSPGFFLRAFKAATGQTPHRFLMERRLAYARRLLEGRKLSASEIAYRTGFSSHAHMTTAFKRAFGIAPSHYRRGL